jgi:hypothetical protein
MKSVVEACMYRICAIALSCVAFGVVTTAAPGPPDTTTVYKGFVSDRQCGTAVDAACNKRCFEQGQKPVLVVDGTGAVLDIANGDKVTSMPGGHVEITGKMDQDNKLIVVRVEALK